MSWRSRDLTVQRARIDDLAQLVTDYARQHEQHTAALERQATALQAQLQQHDTQVGILTEQYAHITEDYKTLSPPCWRRPDPEAAAHREDAGVARPGLL